MAASSSAALVVVDPASDSSAEEVLPKGRVAMAPRFCRAKFPLAKVSALELETFRETYLPPGFRARIGKEAQRLNSFSLLADPPQRVFSLSQFKSGLRLPLWPEFCSVLNFFGMVPAQVHPNGVAAIMGLASFLRSEGVEFDLDVFRRLFIIRAAAAGFCYVNGAVMKITGGLPKVHNWSEKLVVISGDFAAVPVVPIQPPDSAFAPPALAPDQLELVEYFTGKVFNLQTHGKVVEGLPFIPPGQGKYRLSLAPAKWRNLEPFYSADTKLVFA